MKRLLWAVGLIGLIFVIWISRDSLSISGMLSHYAEFKRLAGDQFWWALSLFFLSYVASVSLSLPIASFLTLTGSAVFGWVALPTIVLAATTGAFLVFILASTVAREFFFSRADVVLDRVRSVFAKSPIRWLLTMRLIPFFPFWLVNILPALLSMKSRDYLFATLIGILPGTAIYVAVGRGLDTILTAGDEPDWNLLQSPEVWLPLVLLGSLTAVSAVLKSRHQQDRIMMWIRLFVLMTVLMASYSATAQSWSEIEREARGQTVYFYAWGGSPAINQYIDRWAQIASERHQINVEHVKVDDISMVIQGIQTAKRVGASDQGSVDLLWINGENFARMKRDGLLGEPFVAGLPSAEHINLDDPTIATDFSVPTDGLEAPWGRAQLVLMHDQARRPNPPRSMQALLQYVQTNPGRITYPEPPNFHGTTFLKQVLLETTPYPQWLSEPYAADRFQAATEPMWALLDALHPHLWRSGREFPDSAEAMMDLFADGLLDIALSFNPNDASQRILDGRFPPTVRTYIHEPGTIGNTHFLAIPFNASARAGAQVWINLLLSVEAQADKASPSVWGDPTVIDLERLQGADQERFEALELGPATLTGAELGTPLAEPHASWVEPLEAAWKSRYFGQAQ